MAKFCDVVGYGVSTETVPGVWTDVIVERKYFGDIRRNTRRLEEKELKVNSDISVGNTIEIVSDPYANNNFHAIRYIRWAGSLWTVSSVEVRSPRLILQLGSVYNGPTA